MAVHDQTARELTDQYYLDRVLTKRDEQLRLIIDSVPVLIAYVDASERFQFTNKLHQEWWNRSEHEIVGRRMVEVLGPEIYSAAQGDITAALSGKIIQFERAITYPGVGLRYVRCVYAPHRDGAGGVSGFFVVVSDLTAQYESELVLKQSEDRFRRLVENTKVIPWEADLSSWRFTYVGPRAEEILGYSKELWYESGFWETHIHPEDREQAIATCTQRSQSGKDYEFEYRMVAADGRTVWFRDLVGVIHEQGVPAKLQGFLIDITESKAAEAERERLKDQLVQSQKMEALGTLAGGIAHDFNNILGSIIGYTDLALEQVKDVRISLHEYLQRIKISSNRAKELVQEILAFSKKREDNRMPVDLCILSDEVLKLARAVMPTTVRFEKRYEVTDAYVLANPVQLHQVLLNLCINAEHAMRDSSGVLTVIIGRTRIEGAVAQHHPTLPPGSYISISVLDTGHGMNPDVQKRIFEPYFTTKSVGEGTGLGLSVAHGIIASHGGVITVKSQVGHGSQFDILLPETERSEEHRIDQTGERDVRGKGKILFVDDEEMLAGLGRESLTLLGYHVVACTSSLHALELFQTEPGRFDLVISDQTMPDMTGDLLVRKLHEIRPDIPVILCTGYSASMDDPSFETIGVSAILMKPFSLQVLGETVKRVLDNGPADRGKSA